FYNGFKLMKRGVWPLYGQELQVLRGIVEREEFATAPPGGREKLDAYGEYRSYFLAHTRFAKNMRIVLDTGNGSAGIFAPKLFREAGCEVIELYCEPDATFPNHDPDPEAPQNMRDLGEQVRQRQADFGIALDADGDRAGFVDEQGAFVSADLSLLLFAKDALSRNPGRKILFDVKSTQLLQELVPRYGGVPLMHQTGHAPIKETLRRDEAIIFGGEVSGHFYFVEDYFRIDDGMFAAAKMLELASRHPGSFSSLFSEFPHRVRTPEIKLPCEDEKKFEIVEKIKKDLEGLYPGITIDGLRFQVSDTGWGLIRASNTSPYLTVRVEGASEEEVLKIKGILADELKKVPGIPDSLNREKVAALEGKLGWL
ncbi:MAG: phosphomannomutase/phosphoglucomutase, partial [Candidatus Yanofskybacteria bacterium]|nr:phosphomannomutase/phosphoglucomutase [Candidatus Yanofskybacteria bacterium]